jgi:hypothetical protein
VLGAIQAQNQQLEQQEKAAKAQRREQSFRNSLDLLNKEIPGFNLEKEAPRLRDAAQKRYGYSPEELAEISDGRFTLMLHDALKWRELQTAKPQALKKVADAPKVIKPAAPQPKRENQAALERLRKTGRAENLVDFL